MARVAAGSGLQRIPIPLDGIPRNLPPLPPRQYAHHKFITWSLLRLPDGFCILFAIDCDWIPSDINHIRLEPEQVHQGLDNAAGTPYREYIDFTVLPLDVVHSPKILDIGLVIDLGNTHSTVFAVSNEPTPIRVVPLVDTRIPELVRSRVDKYTIVRREVVESAVLIEKAEEERPNLTGPGTPVRAPAVAFGREARTMAASGGVTTELCFHPCPKRHIADATELDLQDITGRRVPRRSVQPGGKPAPWRRWHFGAFLLLALIRAAKESLNPPDEGTETLYLRRIARIYLSVPVTFGHREVDGPRPRADTEDPTGSGNDDPAASESIRCGLRACAGLAAELAGLAVGSIDVVADESDAVASFFVIGKLLSAVPEGTAPDVGEAFERLAQTYARRDQGPASSDGRPVISHNPTSPSRSADAVNRANLNVLVFDIGGGTTDISLSTYRLARDGESLERELRFVDGEVFGGDDISRRIMCKLRDLAESKAGPGVLQLPINRLDAVAYWSGRAVLDHLETLNNRLKEILATDDASDAGAATADASGVALRLDVALAVPASWKLLRHDVGVLLNGGSLQNGRWEGPAPFVRRADMADWLDNWPKLKRRLDQWRRIALFCHNEVDRVDVLVVSGMSAKLPQVRKGLAEVAAVIGAEIVNLGEKPSWVAEAKCWNIGDGDLAKVAVALGVSLRVLRSVSPSRQPFEVPTTMFETWPRLLKAPPGVTVGATAGAYFLPTRLVPGQGDVDVLSWFSNQCNPFFDPALMGRVVFKSAPEHRSSVELVLDATCFDVLRSAVDSGGNSWPSPPSEVQRRSQGARFLPDHGTESFLVTGILED